MPPALPMTVTLLVCVLARQNARAWRAGAIQPPSYQFAAGGDPDLFTAEWNRTVAPAIDD